MTSMVQIVEVGPRDGFQSMASIIPTAHKKEVIRRLFDSGIRRMEVTSFVSDRAVPQLADAAEIVRFANALDGLDAQVLVPTARHAERALAAGTKHLSAVLSVSERHNRGNVRRTPLESVEDYRLMTGMMPSGTSMRLNVATAFDCPHEGLVSERDVLDLLDRLVAVNADVEIALCDTTGRANPRQVGRLCAAVIARYPQVNAWAFHGHDTYGLGTANVYAAWTEGIRVFDASVAGLGGCPFAPGATGNVATEDLVWMFEAMGVSTSIQIDALVETAWAITALPDSQTGGRVRDALTARDCLVAAE